MTAALCVLCTSEPARLRKRAGERCSSELYRLLAELDRMLPQLAGLVTPETGAGRTGHRRTDASGAPLNLGAVALLDDRGDLSISAVLGKYGYGTTPAALRARVDDLVASPRLEDLFDDVRRLHREACRVTGQTTSGVARCRRTIDEETGRECGGSIVAAPDNREARCTRCGDVWPRSRWQFLGRLQTQG